MIKTSIGTLTLQDWLEIKKIERQAKLPKDGDFLKPTIGFLRGVQEYLSKTLLKKVSVTQSLQSWYALGIAYASLANRQTLKADVSFWFNLDVTKLSDDELTGYYGNLPRVKAQQRLELGNYDVTDFEAAYNLTMLAYDDEEIAVQARNGAIKAKMEFEAARNKNV